LNTQHLNLELSRTMVHKAVLSVVFVWLSFPSSASAWGSDGHKTIALVAETQLSPKARAEVSRLLAMEPGATLASISTWADEHKNRATAPWHYVNFPRSTCTYDGKRDCPDGNCLIGAIQRQIEILGSKAPAEKRLQALKYVVHLVGDVHQPLHAGYADDKGGNKYQVQFAGRGTNLHAMWDSGLIKALNESPEVLAPRLSKERVKSAAGGIANKFDPVQAAEESCRIVGKEGFYPGRTVNRDYVAKYQAILEQQLVIAGTRLASALNQVLGGAR
jgi:nuclease S1